MWGTDTTELSSPADPGELPRVCSRLNTDYLWFVVLKMALCGRNPCVDYVPGSFENTWVMGRHSRAWALAFWLQQLPAGRPGRHSGTLLFLLTLWEAGGSRQCSSDPAGRPEPQQSSASQKHRRELNGPHPPLHWRAPGFPDSHLVSSSCSIVVRSCLFSVQLSCRSNCYPLCVYFSTTCTWPPHLAAPARWACAQCLRHALSSY